MGQEEERNLCPDCGELVPLAVPACPHCGRIFYPEGKGWLRWYRQCWQLALKFTGRACPAEFYAYTIPNGLLLLWLGCYLWQTMPAGSLGEDGWAAALLQTLLDNPWAALIAGWLLVALVPLPALLLRRLHDTDTGLWDVGEEVEVTQGDIWDAMPKSLGRPEQYFALWVAKTCARTPGEKHLHRSLISQFPERFLSTMAALPLAPFLLFRDSLPGPNRFGPGTSYPRYLDRF